MKHGLAIKKTSRDTFLGIVYAQAGDGSTWVDDIIETDTIDDLCLYFVFESTATLDYVFDIQQSKMIDPGSQTVWEAAEALFDREKETAYD